VKKDTEDLFAMKRYVLMIVLTMEFVKPEFADANLDGLEMIVL